MTASSNPSSNPRAATIVEQPYGWVVVAVATVALALGFGANISVSVLILPLETEFGWTRAEISMGYTMVTIGAGAGGLLWGSLSDRFGQRGIAAIGAISMACALMLVSRQNALWHLYTLYFIIGGLGFGCLFSPLLALVGHWFDRRKGLALGIVTAGGAIGQGVVPHVARLMINAWDWRQMALVLGLTYLVTLLPLVLLLKPAPRSLRSETNDKKLRDETNGWGINHKVSIPWITVAAVFCCICMAVPLVHLVPLLTDRGIEPAAATAMLMTMMSIGVISRIGIGAVADRMGGLKAYLATSACQTFLVFWFPHVQGMAGLYLLAVAFGLSFSGVMTCIIICCREAAPLRLTGTATAVSALGGWIGMGLGGYLGGLFYDLSGSYVMSYGAAGLAGLVNLALLFGLMVYRRRHAPVAVGVVAV